MFRDNVQNVSRCRRTWLFSLCTTENLLTFFFYLDKRICNSNTDTQVLFLDNTYRIFIRFNGTPILNNLCTSLKVHYKLLRNPVALKKSPWSVKMAATAYHSKELYLLEIRRWCMHKPRHILHAPVLPDPRAPRGRPCLCSWTAVTYCNVTPPQTIFCNKHFRGLISVLQRCFAPSRWRRTPACPTIATTP